MVEIEMSIEELATITGWKPSDIRLFGKYSVMNIWLEQQGIEAATNCEDSRLAGQYEGDAIEDIRGLLKKPE